MQGGSWSFELLQEELEHLFQELRLTPETALNLMTCILKRLHNIHAGSCDSYVAPSAFIKAVFLAPIVSVSKTNLSDM